MDEALIARWNKTVPRDAIVYYLGDFGLAPKAILKNHLSRLNGKKKILIRGNHDKAVSSMLEIGFDEVHKYMELNMEGKSMFLSHVPMVSMYHDIVLCGHVHEKFRVNGHIINVGVDVWDFSPVSWKTIKQTDVDKSRFEKMVIPESSH